MASPRSFKIVSEALTTPMTPYGDAEIGCPSERDTEEEIPTSARYVEGYKCMDGSIPKRSLSMRYPFFLFNMQLFRATIVPARAHHDGPNSFLCSRLLKVWHSNFEVTDHSI